MKCPNCNFSLSKWKLLKVTAWSSILCPNCETLCNRKADKQLLLISVVGTLVAIIVPILVFVESDSFTFYYASLALVILLMCVVDIFTVRLYRAEKRKGKSAILGHKIVD